MNRAERRAAYSCNTKDLIKLINDPKYKDNKEAQFNDIVKYIARHEMYHGNTKSDLFDLVYTARNELIAQEAKVHKDYYEPLPYNKIEGVSEKESNRIKDFIRDPIQSLRKEFKDLATNGVDNNETDYDKAVYNERLETNATMLFTELNVGNEKGMYEYGNHQDRIDVLSRLSKRLPKDANIDEAINRVNSGVFGRLFRRPSKEYKAFENSLKEFKDAGMAHAGNIDDLEKNTLAYLKHTIPEFDASKLAEKKAEWLSCLPKGKRGRAELAMNVMESISEHKEMKPYMDNVDKGVKGLPIDESVDKDKANQKDSQIEFQKNLVVDLGNNEIQNNEAVKEENLAKEHNKNDIEEEKLDKTEDDISL